MIFFSSQQCSVESNFGGCFKKETQNLRLQVETQILPPEFMVSDKRRNQVGWHNFTSYPLMYNHF